MNRKPSKHLLIGLTSFLLATALPHNGAAQSTGQQLYERHCSACHSMQPPPTSAPPIIGLTHFYHKAFSDREQGIRHMMAFIAKPDAADSKLRAPAITRFGLMPAINLTEQDLRIVSEWVWNQYNPAFEPPDCPAN